MKFIKVIFQNSAVGYVNADRIAWIEPRGGGVIRIYFDGTDPIDLKMLLDDLLRQADEDRAIVPERRQR